MVWQVLNDLEGRRFGKLTVIKLAGMNHSGKAMWLCKCDCGRQKKIARSELLRKRPSATKSCGCMIGKDNFKHGKCFSRSYDVWSSMKARCNDPKKRAYKNYGGRGITVCTQWNSFEGFYADMGDPPAGMSIERKDVNGNYEPGNCVWATPKQQGRNQRKTIRLTFLGVTKALADWADLYGVRKDTIHNRLTRGWSVEDAITLRPNKGRKILQNGKNRKVTRGKRVLERRIRN